jgi:hypothetical protein
MMSTYGFNMVATRRRERKTDFSINGTCTEFFLPRHSV